MTREEIEHEAISTYDGMDARERRSFFITLIQSIPFELLENIRNSGQPLKP